MLSFKSYPHHVNWLNAFSQEQVKAEPMLFSADWEFAEKHGGPITRQFLEVLDAKGWRGAIFDSRTHMLMSGWYPCIPGWHLDDVPRTRKDGQPDHANPRYKAEHVMAVVGDASLTEFINNRVELEDVPEGKGVVYGVWNEQLRRCLHPNDIRVARDREVIAFDWQTFHRGVPAIKSGWRFFIRASRNTERKFTNEIRSQVQVYLPAPEAGW